jgi:RNA polymerase sigma-70 factor, ECF subfamily
VYKLVSNTKPMQESELISACMKHDKAAQKQFFELFYGKLAYIALRYSKNSAQADDLTTKGFNHVFSNLSHFNPQSEQTLEDFVIQQFIRFSVKYIKEIRNEYYVASTVRAVEPGEKSFDLFSDSILIDFKTTPSDVLLKSIQELVPSQRLVFNLHVIDNYTLANASEVLETSEQTLKSNLEKARFNLQKSIEKNLKLRNNEQPV